MKNKIQQKIYAIFQHITQFIQHIFSFVEIKNKMKELIKKYKKYKYKVILFVSQKYADFIINQIDNSKSEFELNYWFTQGIMLDTKMIELYDIYLE